MAEIYKTKGYTSAEILGRLPEIPHFGSYRKFDPPASYLVTAKPVAEGVFRMTNIEKASAQGEAVNKVFRS